MLPGLQQLLESVPPAQRHGFVANPSPPEYDMKSQSKAWFMPTVDDMADLIQHYSNCAIGRACGVSEQTVRNWINRLGLARSGSTVGAGVEVAAEAVDDLRQRSVRSKHRKRPAKGRLGTDRVSKIIAQIGEEADIIVRQPDEEAGRRIKYASAHDTRRSCAERLINAGVSAETLMVIMRHREFSTTRKFYGAKRAAQSAAAEVHKRLINETQMVVEVYAGTETGQLTADEAQAVQQLLEIAAWRPTGIRAGCGPCRSYCYTSRGHQRDILESLKVEGHQGGQFGGVLGRQVGNSLFDGQAKISERGMVASVQ